MHLCLLDGFGEVVIAGDEEEHIGCTVACMCHEVEADAKVNALLFAVDAEPSESELHFGEFADTFLLRVRDSVAGRVVPMHPQHRQSGLCLRCGRQCADQFPVVDMNTAPQRRAGDASCSRSEEIPGIDVKGASRPHAPLWHAADRGHSRSQSTALAVGRPCPRRKLAAKTTHYRARRQGNRLPCTDRPAIGVSGRCGHTPPVRCR